ncbi:MAG: RHS Repeat protein [Bacteroidetes bacterium ADurb.Bin041]|nr:MAG: RHS Repeat protein [Bacteroidetes bacterium ADurb.Bin041]
MQNGFIIIYFTMKKIKETRAYFITVPAQEEFENYRTSANRQLLLTMIYDENGNLLEDHKYDNWGKLLGKTVYRYDNQNNRILEETFDPEDNLEERTTFEFENNKPVKGYIHYLDDSKDEILFHYNQSGKLIMKEWISDEGEIDKTEQFVFSGDQLVLHKITEDGETILKNEFKRDENGNILEFTYDDKEDFYRQVNEFDSNGKLISSLKYNDEAKLTQNEQFTYDEHDNQIGIVRQTARGITKIHNTFTDGKISSSSEMEYNQEDKLIRQIDRYFDETGELTELRVYDTGWGQEPLKKYMIVYENDLY